MRVDIKTQKAVPFKSAMGETRTQTNYNVVLSGRGQETVIATFSTPGTFTEGFLSDTQAKVRARETAQRMKDFLSAQGELDGEEAAPEDVRRTGSRRAHASAYSEPKSFARVG